MTQNDLLRTTRAYQEGRTAYLDGIQRSHNPYFESSDGRHIDPAAWTLGWDDEQEQEPDWFKDEQL